MSTTVGIDSATGVSPFQIWAADSCDALSQQTYLCQVATNADFPATFNLPTIYENIPFCIKVIDADLCVVCECFGFGPSPTPTATPTVTPTITLTPTPTLTPSATGPCLNVTYYDGVFEGNGFTETVRYTLSTTLFNGQNQLISPNNGSIQWSGTRWEI